MKIFKIILCLLLVISHNFVFGQKKKKATNLPPKIVKIVPPIIKPNDLSSPYTNNSVYKILLNNTSTSAFTWEINSDTLLTKNSLFKETIQFQNFGHDIIDGEIISNTLPEDQQIKKKEADDKMVNIFSYYSKRKRQTFSIVKNVITLTDSETNTKRQFKVNVDKSGKRIMSLQDVQTQKRYLPSEPDYPSVSL